MSDTSSSAAREHANRMFRWLYQVAADPELPELAGTVAVAICHYVDRKKGYAYAFRRTLAKFIGRSERAVTRSVSAMVKRGHLDRWDQGLNKPNWLTPIVKVEGAIDGTEASCRDARGAASKVGAETLEARHRPLAETLAPSRRDARGAAAGTLGARRTYVREPRYRTSEREALARSIGLEGNPQQASTSVNGKASTSTESAVDRTFDEFWRAYPRKTDREQARRLYEQAIRNGETTPERMIQGARNYARWCEQENQPSNIKSPMWWLKDKRWTDEPPPEKRQWDPGI